MTLAMAAVIIGAAVAVIGLVLAGWLIYFTHGRVQYVWLLLPLALVAGVITAAVLAIRWTHEAAVRAWRLEDADRWYLLQLRQEEPAPVRDLVRVELAQPLDGQARQTQIADLEASQEQLASLARGLLGGQPFAETAWTGSGRPFSRGQFAALRSVFISRRWAEWRNPEAPAQGIVLTGAGKAVLRALAGEDISLPHRNAGSAQDEQ